MQLLWWSHYTNMSEHSTEKIMENARGSMVKQLAGCNKTPNTEKDDCPAFIGQYWKWSVSNRKSGIIHNISMSSTETFRKGDVVMRVLFTMNSHLWRSDCSLVWWQCMEPLTQFSSHTTQELTTFFLRLGKTSNGVLKWEYFNKTSWDDLTMKRNSSELFPSARLLQLDSVTTTAHPPDTFHSVILPFILWSFANAGESCDSGSW